MDFSSFFFIYLFS